MSEHPLDQVVTSAGARWEESLGVRMAADYGDVRAEHEVAFAGAAICDARDRGVIEIRGRDRATWLHNLVTNTIKTLQPGEGNYGFAINVKGRILMDFNMLVLGDAIWLDIDRRLIAKALAHFDRYTITEDVQCRDRSGEFARIALTGPKAAEIADALGATNAPVMAALSSAPVALAGRHRLMVRHDFAGVFGVEFFVESEDAARCWERLLEIGAPVGLRPVGRAAIETLRIEAGIPRYGQDIDEEVLPAETDQIERAISYVKGCYLGQEVVERMRSRGALARKLVGLRFSDEGVQPAAPLRAGEAEVGRVTSVCRSFALAARIGLGYLRTGHTEPGTRVSVGAAGAVTAEVVPLPMR